MNWRITKADQLVARLYSGNLTESDAVAIRQWRLARKANDEAFQDALNAWDSVEGLQDDKDVRALTLPQTRRWARRDMRIAGAALLFFGGSAIIAFILQSFDYGAERLVVHETAIGGTDTVFLSDGSVVTLNTNTRFVVSYSDDSRRTVLERGEAYFDVQEDLERPFRVEIGKRAVTVLGTRFNVYREASGAAEVSVFEGMVAVHDQRRNLTGFAPLIDIEIERAQALEVDENFRIGRGMVASFDGPDEFIVVTRADVERTRTWQRGYVRFEGETLAEVVAEIGRYTDREIVIIDTMAAELLVDAVFQIDGLEMVEGWLAGIERTQPVLVNALEDRFVISYDYGE